MTLPAYGTRRGLYRHGLRADALVALPRAVAAVDVPSSTFTLRGHGLSAGDVLTFEAKPPSQIYGGLSAALPYLASPLSGDLFRITTTGGAPVTVLSAGSGLISVVLDLDAAIDDSLRGFSRHIDQHLPAHETPLVVVPEHIELYLYWLVSHDLVVTRGLGNPAYKDSAAALGDRAKLAQVKLDELHQKVQGVVGAVDQTPGRSERRAIGYSAGDRWTPPGGGFL